MISGIYKITNTVNGKAYVGSSKNIQKRFKTHMYALDSNEHHSVKLQRAWNKHGSSKFTFDVILLCSIENLIMYEQICIDHNKAAELGYNICIKSGSREGAPHSKDVVNKMTEIQRSYRKKYLWKDSMMCLSEIAEFEHIERDLLIRRVNEDKWDLEQAVTRKYHERDRKFTAFGKTRTAKEWAEYLCHPLANIYGWLKIYDNFEDVVTAAKKITVHELARTLNANPNRFQNRIRAGWDIANALTAPNFYRYKRN